MAGVYLITEEEMDSLIDSLKLEEMTRMNVRRSGTYKNCLMPSMTVPGKIPIQNSNNISTINAA